MSATVNPITGDVVLTFDQPIDAVEDPGSFGGNIDGSPASASDNAVKTGPNELTLTFTSYLPSIATDWVSVNGADALTFDGATWIAPFTSTFPYP